MSIHPQALLEGLNPEQEKAVTHEEGPLLIVAGAGTGKTTVIAKRIAWLIATGRAASGEILALTFTEKAATEMEERVDRLLPIGYVELWISTFHAFCERILRERGIDIGLPRDFRLLNETGGWLMLRQHLSELGLKYYRPLGDPARFLHDLLGHFSRAKDEIVSPEDYAAYAESLLAETPEQEKERIFEIARAYAAYQRILFENKALDFGDLIASSIRLFRERPPVLNLFRKRFKYILVDEFQDTNYAQYELVKLLAGKRGNVTVVGDDDQSIYKFRGASVSNILGFMDDHPNAARVFLTTNYRSQQEILDLSHLFIKQNDPNRLEHRLAGTGGLSKRLSADRGSGAELVRVTAETLESEASFVASEIRRLKEADPEATWSDFAILFRANAHAKPFLEALALEGIPHLYVASKGLYAKPVVQDAICYLKLLDTYHESPALFRTLAWRVFDLPDKAIVALAHDAKKHACSLWDSLAEAREPLCDAETLGKFRRVQGLLQKHAHRAVRTHPSRLLKEIFVDSGYYAELVADEAPERLEAIRCLNQFLKTVQAYEEGDPRPTLRGFMRQLEWEIESGEEGTIPFDIDEGPETVKLMTAHTSKGLEFKTVFVVQLVDGRFPSRDHHEPIPYPDALVKETLPLEGDPHLEEERRLFYVACTRARDRLYLTGAEDVGGTRKKKPSRFLAEIEAIEGAKKLLRVAHARAERAFAETAPAPAKAGSYVLELPKEYSFSQLAAYEKCPLQYKFAHLLKIPTIDKGQLNFGKTVHGVLESFIKCYQETPERPMSEEEILAEYDRLWNGEWYEDPVQKSRFYGAGKDAVRHVRRRTLLEKPLPWLVESPFSIKVGSHTIRGKIDRVDKLPDGRVVIVDYKTGKAKEKIDTEMKAQLHIYQLALADVWNVETADMYFWFVNEDVIGRVDPLSGNLERMRDRLEARIKDLEASDFSPTPGEHTCKYCDFRDICKYKVL